MALNTNGWDYIYTVTIDKLQKLIDNSTERTKLIDSNEIKGKTPGNVDFTLTTTTVNFKVLATSDYNVLDVAMTISGKYNDTTPTSIDTDFTDLVITFKLNIDWLNRYDNTVTSTDITFVGITGGTAIAASFPKLNNIFKLYLNGSNNVPGYTITRSANHSYLKYYIFFASLNPFGTSTDKNLEWMKMEISNNIGVQRFSAKKDIHKAGSGFFSFSCMIGSRKNNDPGYVDLNAIPGTGSVTDPTSALIIERSVFAEYMVKPAFGTTNAFSDGLNTKLEKSGAYAFTNNAQVTLQSKDYLNENNEPVPGTVEQNRLLLSVEESAIKLSMGDVGYQYDTNGNNPTINQEYVFSLKQNVSTFDCEAKEKLFIISNDFKPDRKSENWLNIGGPIIKNFIPPLLMGIGYLFAARKNKYATSSFVIIDKKPEPIPQSVRAIRQPQQQNLPQQGSGGVVLDFNKGIRRGGMIEMARIPANESQKKSNLDDSSIEPLLEEDEKNAFNQHGKRLIVIRNDNNFKPVSIPLAQNSQYYLGAFFNKVNMLLGKFDNKLLDRIKAGNDLKQLNKFNKYKAFLESVNEVAEEHNFKSDAFIKIYDEIIKNNKERNVTRWTENETTNPCYLFQIQDSWCYDSGCTAIFDKEKEKYPEFKDKFTTDYWTYFEGHQDKVPFNIYLDDTVKDKHSNENLISFQNIKVFLGLKK